MKVLVVDDDPVILAMAEGVLRSLGHDVVTRDHALGTTSTIFEERPDVTLSSRAFRKHSLSETRTTSSTY